MPKLVLNQLRYSGVLEVVRIRRQGYPVKADFESFAHDFDVLLNAKGGAKADSESP